MPLLPMPAGAHAFSHAVSMVETGSKRMSYQLKMWIYRRPVRYTWTQPLPRFIDPAFYPARSIHQNHQLPRRQVKLLRTAQQPTDTDRTSFPAEVVLRLRSVSRANLPRRVQGTKIKQCPRYLLTTTAQVHVLRWSWDCCLCVSVA